MITELAHIRETRLVSYELTFGPEGDVVPVPMWKLDHAGSYAEGHERLRYETLRVKGCRISLFRRQGLWHVDGIVVSLSKGTDTVVHHVELSTDPVPMWLANLCAQAAQEDA